VVDEQGNVYCLHQAEDKVLKITPEGKVSTFAVGVEGEGRERKVRFANLHALSLDARGNLYTCGDAGDTGVWKIDPAGKMTRHYPPQGWYQQLLIGTGGDPFTVDADGTIYCINEKGAEYCQILKVSPAGRVSQFAGGEAGFSDGEKDKARFQGLHSGALRFGPDGCLYVAEPYAVRKVTKEGQVTTLAGGAEGGYADGDGKAARFGFLRGLAVDRDGAVYAADAKNLRLRKITADGKVTTVAGSGTRGGRDGKGEEAAFDEPSGVAVDAKGNVFVLELVGREWKPRVRKLSPGGEVSTLADLSR
jgi:sugar lactone lactonase YvrE